MVRGVSRGRSRVGAVLVLAGAWATAEVSLHEFGPGTVIRSSEVNENDLALADALATEQERVVGESAAGSSIRVINEDGTLTGDGTSIAPLGLADEAVTGAKLSDFGASAGQVLKFDGGAWVAGDDEDTIYSASEGLSSSGNEFSLDTAFADARYITPDDNGGIAVSGQFEVGTIRVEGAGARLMWYPGRAALRVGRVSASQWDDRNVGNHLVAMGRDTTTSGDGSVAMGTDTTARGLFATATGLGTRAYANDMVAIGRYNSPTGVTGSGPTDRPAFVVGNGASNPSPSHAWSLSVSVVSSRASTTATSPPC